MDYLDSFIKGTCVYMCPLREQYMREREGLLHILEIRSGTEHLKRPRADCDKVVKEYCRPAAGQRPPKPLDLRPLGTLKSTVQYLLKLAYSPTELDWAVIYDFVADRLRAVRQDLVMQGLSGEESLPLLESMVLFHVYAGYILCECPVAVFDPKLNSDMMLDCLKRCLVLYDFGAQSTHHSTIEALYGIVGGGNYEALNRLASLPEYIRCKETRLAYEMMLSFDMGNFVRGFRLLARLPPTLACGAVPLLPSLRRNALLTLSAAYNSKALCVPASVVSRWLSLPSDQDTLEECAHFGLSCDETSINFQRTAFSETARKVPCRRLHYLDNQLENIEDLCKLFCVN